MKKDFICILVAAVGMIVTFCLLDGVIPDKYLRYVVLGVGFFIFGGLKGN